MSTVILSILMFGFGFSVAVFAFIVARKYRQTRAASSVESTYAIFHADWLSTAALSLFKPDVVMMGDSITAGANWNELFGLPLVINRSRGGETTHYALSRIDAIIDLRPKAVFILSGVNDLTDAMTAEETANNISAMLDKLSAAGIAAYVTAIFPVASFYKHPLINNRAIAIHNAAIEAAVAARHDAIFLRVAKMSDGPGCLNNALTIDGLHPNSKGYAVWREFLLPYVARHTGSYVESVSDTDRRRAVSAIT